MRDRLFQIKICGVTTSEDAELSVQAGADAIGLNFCAASKRRVEVEAAGEIVSSIRGKAALVGVFVDSPVREISRIAAELQLDYVQLHGDEPPEQCAALSKWGVIKAFRFRADRQAAIPAFLDKCGKFRPRGLLLDSYHAMQHGGTGIAADWPAVAAFRTQLRGTPLILAGGLRAENVAEAIGIVRPEAVDSASGVESEPARKDPLLVRQFVEAARQALDECATVD